MIVYKSNLQKMIETLRKEQEKQKVELDSTLAKCIAIYGYEGTQRMIEYFIDRGLRNDAMAWEIATSKKRDLKGE